MLTSLKQGTLFAYTKSIFTVLSKHKNFHNFHGEATFCIFHGKDQKREIRFQDKIKFKAFLFQVFPVFLWHSNFLLT